MERNTEVYRVWVRGLQVGDKVGLQPEDGVVIYHATVLEVKDSRLQVQRSDDLKTDTRWYQRTEVANIPVGRDTRIMGSHNYLIPIPVHSEGDIFAARRHTRGIHGG